MEGFMLLLRSESLEKEGIEQGVGRVGSWRTGDTAGAEVTCGLWEIPKTLTCLC